MPSSRPISGSSRTARAEVLWAGGILAGYVLALAVVPRLLATDPSLPNVAAREGYDIHAAYLALASWTVVSLLLVAARLRRTPGGQPQPAVEATEQPRGAAGPWLWGERLALAAAAMLAYWPFFLARHGHYIEDAYFMNMLLRVQCGNIPYRDFEFLYGPLMIHPAAWWMDTFGYSLVTYYALLAIAEVTALVVLLWTFQRHIAATRPRLLAFAVFVPFVLDTLLGLNYTGWRGLLPILAIMTVAARPADVRAAAGAAVLIGVQLAFSYEYGLVGYAAILLLFAALWFGRLKETGVLPAAVFSAGAPVAGAGLTWMVTGAAAGDYVRATLHLLQAASTSGLGNLPFHWTVNSLALFALLSVAIVAVGRGIPRLATTPTTYGDRLLLGVLLFAVGSMRFGIQRADIWHLTIPFTGLLLVVLWAPRLSLFASPPVLRRFALAAVVVASVTRLIGILPEGSQFAAGLVRGARDVVTGTPRAAGVDARAHSILSEGTRDDPPMRALAAALASPEWRARPVMLYGESWWQGIYLGVCPSGYAAYKLMYTDAYRPATAFLDANPRTLVVIDRQGYGELFEGVTAPAGAEELSLTKRAGLWLSSIHWAHKDAERAIRHEVWRQRLGRYLVTHYRPAVTLEDDVVLERR